MIEQNSLLSTNDHHNTSWQNLKIENVLQKMEVSEIGLNDDEVKKRRREFEKNILTMAKPPGIIKIFFRQFLNPLIYILIIAGIISFLLKELFDAFFIFIVIILNAIVGTWQENKAEKISTSLKQLIKIKITVIRNGEEIEIDSEELVPGDLVKLFPGNKIPADIRLIESKNLLADESLLTGESQTTEKQSINTVATDAPLIGQTNMLFAGTTIMAGRATGIVVRTGSHSEVGKIAKVISTTKNEKPPLILRMENFTKKISAIILIACLLLVLISFTKGIALTELFFLAVALAVAAIPEGLPVALTVVLSVAAYRMSKRNVVVRKLTAVEGLGSCTLIASDKTGTLTINQQTAKIIWFPSGIDCQIEGQGYNSDGQIKIFENFSNKNTQNDLKEIVEAGIINNEGGLEENAKKWTYHGDSIDVAFLALGIKQGIDLEKFKKTYEIVSAIPYESENRFSAIKIYTQKQTKLYAKGATEEIMGMCSQMLVNGKNKTIEKQEIIKQVKKMTANGYRVLALSQKIITGKNTEVLNKKELKEMVFLGLVGFIDPLREETKYAVEKCHGAGIKVIMITGDHPATALFIAKQLGIAQKNSDVITGEQIGKIGPSDTPEFYEKISSYKIFAQVTPIQKHKIVDAFNKVGHFVAVTGDGVNDAPALKRANLGVAMGSGTDVAKESSSMIVIDDNFSSIVAGVEEGRFAYSNIRKVIYLLITTGFAEIALFILAVFSDMPLPLFAVQLLWLNLVTNGIQHIALAFEPGEAGVMSEPPRSPKEAIFNPLMIQQTLLSGFVMGVVALLVWFVGLRILGLEENFARNLLFLLMIMFENLHVLNCRSEHRSIFKIPLSKNKILIMAIVGAHALHIFAMYNPLLSKVLNISPVSLKNWVVLFLIATSVLITSEIFKYIKNKNSKKYNTLQEIAS